MAEETKGPAPAPLKPVRKAASSETGIALDDLDPRSRARLLDEAKRSIIGDMRLTLQQKAEAENLAALRKKHHEEFRDAMIRRVLGFLTALVPLADRFSAFATKGIADRNVLDSVADKFPGTALNKRQRMSMAGLIASLGYQFTAREDGSGGQYLKGVLNPQGTLVGFKFEGGPKEQANQYVADPVNGLARTS